MAAIDYERNGGWGNIGWLGSDEYYAFWGKKFAERCAHLFSNSTILDIGAGNGRVWESALDQGLNIKELHLIDPYLSASEKLLSKPNVHAHKKTLEECADIHGDIAVFKQSFHHIYEALGANLFDHINATRFINFAMPESPDWPMSPALKEKYAPSCLDIRLIINQANKKVTESFHISYPVIISQDQWCRMLNTRFTSILHDCDEGFIEEETKWVRESLPEQLQFYDHIECLVFE